MRNVLLASFGAAILLALIGANRIAKPLYGNLNQRANLTAVSCGSSATGFIGTNADGRYIPLLAGLGQHEYHIGTSSDSAQIFFNQGLNFYYSYHFREARASFKEAARFDSKAAMAWWGQALAMGPYFNTYYYKMEKGLPQVLQAMTACQGASSKEKDLLAAMAQRYSSDSTNKDRPLLDSQYASAMRKLVKRYPADNEIKALYIDAVMLQHKWDFWTITGTPRPWTPELINTCLQILKTQPNHPAALHYYIHLTEASRRPKDALPGAERLRKMMPGAGHMVHMATHMYQRNGYYAKGVTVNEDANAINNKVDALAPNLGIGQDKLVHVYAVQSFCALNAGMYEKALPVYARARNRVLALAAMAQDAGAQEVFMAPVIAMVRNGKWKQILSSPAPDSAWVFAYMLDNFAKGMASVKTKSSIDAKWYLAAIEHHLKESLLQPRALPFNAPVQIGRIAALLLSSAIAADEEQPDRATLFFKQAILAEDSLIYREPQEWKLPVRQYYGAFLLNSKKPARAEKIYLEDLVRNPGNGWSLMGMYQAQRSQKKTSANVYKRLYEAAFSDADIIPPASVF